MLREALEGSRMLAVAMEPLAAPARPPASWVDLVAGTFLFNPITRQTILETVPLTERLRLLLQSFLTIKS